jgi:hypothetical protein
MGHLHLPLDISVLKTPVYKQQKFKNCYLVVDLVKFVSIKAQKITQTIYNIYHILVDDKAKILICNKTLSFA